MNYEAAKAHAFLGIAACSLSDSANALKLFAKARELFLLEQNSTWPALLDLYRAMVLYQTGRWPEALKTVKAAQSVLSHSALKDRAALAELLRSLLHLELGDSGAARYWGELALDRIEHFEIIGLRYLAEFVLGCVRESQNDLDGAHQCYARAKTAFANLASLRQREGMSVPLLKDRDSIYWHLISVVRRLPGPALPQNPCLGSRNRRNTAIY